MRKHLAVVGVVTMSMAAAAPASARLADPVPAGTRPAVTFAPGMSDAAQSGYKPHPVARVALPPDLRGEAARAAADPQGPDLRGEAARAAANPQAPDLRGEAARAAANPQAPDLRGEAARAAADPQGPAPAAHAPVAAPAAAGPDDGLDWTSLGLGAGGGLVLAAMTAGGVVLSTRRGLRVRPSR